MIPELVTIQDIAKLIKKHPSYVYKHLPKWRDRGVRVLQTDPNTTPRFYLSDILKMMEQPK